MSDTQRDREERQHVIEVLKSWDGYFIGYTSDEVQEALRYAIASIKTDLKYDLLYEGVDCNNCKNNWHRGDGSTYCATGDGICHYECEEPTTKNDIALIHTEGLDEEIRCAMCTNSIKSDRGCDGGCVVNNAMYKEVMDVIENHIVDTDKMVEPTTKNNLGVDCISRTQAIERLKLNFPISQGADNSRDRHRYMQAQADLQAIRELPSVTPQEPRWISVSEKLPDDRDWYLGIFKEPDTGWINPLPFICDYVGRETKATTKEFWILHGFTDMDEHIDYYFNLECVAWMPLPHKAESEG